MRKMPILPVLFALVVSPAFANDIQEQAPKMRADFIDAYNKPDVAALTASYTADAVLINPTGVISINAQVIEGWFKDGPRKLDTTFDHALSLGADTALGIGTFQITGTNLKGDPVNFRARWTAAYIRDGDKWKLRMQTVVPLPTN
jgi:ketosteroid isomerase-like protein